jgi:hypothetical protein
MHVSMQLDTACPRPSMFQSGLVTGYSSSCMYRQSYWQYVCIGQRVACQYPIGGPNMLVEAAQNMHPVFPPC